MFSHCCLNLSFPVEHYSQMLLEWQFPSPKSVQDSYSSFQSSTNLLISHPPVGQIDLGCLWWSSQKVYEPWRHMCQNHLQSVWTHCCWYHRHCRQQSWMPKRSTRSELVCQFYHRTCNQAELDPRASWNFWRYNRLCHNCLHRRQSFAHQPPCSRCT